jgi:hypothetical protein
VVVGGPQAWPVPYRAVDVYGAATGAAYEVMVVVSDPVLVPSRRAGRLDPPDEVIFGQDAQGVVDRLTRDGADVIAHQPLDLLRRPVRPAGHGPHDSQSLSRHLNPSPPEQVGRAIACLPEHNSTLALILDFVKFARDLQGARPESSVVAATPTGGGMNKAGRTRVLFLTCLGTLGLLATACGGGSPSAGVAHIGTATTATTGLAGPSVTSLSGLQSDELKFAQCMRSHGVPAYPDPGGQGGLPASKAAAGGELNRTSPQFQAARRDCSGLMPSGAPASPAQQAAVTAKAVQFAECMRAHGVPGFPDPGSMPGGRKSPGGGYFVEAQSGPLSPDNPQFARAQKVCRNSTGGNY